MCSFDSSIETGLDSLSNQDSKTDNGFSELPYKEDFENNIQVAPSSAAHGPAAIPFVLNKKQKRKYRSWDESFKGLRSGPLGAWVHHQRQVFHGLKGRSDSPLTNKRDEKLESIGFVFIYPPSWDQRFQKLVDFKKNNGHTNVPQGSGPLRTWVRTQQQAFNQFKGEKYDSPLTNGRHEKLESIGFVFVCPPRGPSWDQRFQELVDFKKSNGHMYVPTNTNFGPLRRWVDNQRRAFRRIDKGKHSSLSIERCFKFECIGVRFSTHEKNHEHS
eukprot:scaffold101015_cov35-Attheya_sp.AAC.1